MAEQRRQAGMDVVAVVELPHLVSLPDDELLVEASVQGRILVTANIRDFAALSKEWVARPRQHAHHGLVYVSSQRFPQDRSYVGALVSALASAVRQGLLPVAGGEMFLRR